MGPLVEINLIVQRELLRTARSTKGIILGAITLAGALVTAFVCTYIEGRARQEIGASAEPDLHEMLRHATESPSLVLFFSITVWLGPLLVAILGFDVMAGDLQHRSVRFWAVRSRRASFFVAKFLALWATVALVTLGLNLLAGIIAAVRGYVTPWQLLTWGGRYWLTSLPILAAWAAIATFVSALFRTPIAALLTTSGVFGMLFLFSAVGRVVRENQMKHLRAFVPMTWAEYLYPNGYDEVLLDSDAKRIALGLGILLGFALLLNVAGSFLFARRDL
jgi:ABC-2 type transport system permease protein